MPMSGDFAALSRLRVSLASMQEVPRAAADEAAPSVDGLLQQEFASSRGPEGQAWAPLAASTRKRGRSGRPLVRTGRMAAGTRALPTPSGLGVRYPFPGPVHNAGAPSVGVPARPIVPSGSSLPTTWSLAVKDAARRQILARLGRTR